MRSVTYMSLNTSTHSPQNKYFQSLVKRFLVNNVYLNHLSNSVNIQIRLFQIVRKEKSIVTKLKSDFNIKGTIYNLTSPFVVFYVLQGKPDLKVTIKRRVYFNNKNELYIQRLGEKDTTNCMYSFSNSCLYVCI